MTGIILRHTGGIGYYPEPHLPTPLSVALSRASVDLYSMVLQVFKVLGECAGGLLCWLGAVEGPCFCDAGGSVAMGFWICSKIGPMVRYVRVPDLDPYKPSTLPLP